MEKEPRSPRFENRDTQDGTEAPRRQRKTREVRVFDKKRPERPEHFKDTRQDSFLGSLSPNLNVMIKAVQRAGRSLMRDFGEVEQLQVSRKGTADFVSSADMNAERILRETLKEARPRYGFLTEESGAVTGADTSHRWVIDPLDGTTNFLHGIAYFSISLALQEDNEIIAGVVYNPVTNELYYAEKGGGAWSMTFTGNYRLRVSNRSNLADALCGVAIPCPAYGNRDRFVSRINEVMTKTTGARCLGSTALDLAYVAAGKFDAYFVEGEKPWDVAAGILLIKEAGGHVCTLDGDEKVKSVLESPSMMAANDSLYTKFYKMFKMTEAEKQAEK